MKRKRDVFESGGKEPEERDVDDFSSDLRKESEKELGSIENLFVQKQQENLTISKDESSNQQNDEDSDSSDSIYLSDDYVVPDEEESKFSKTRNEESDEESDEDDVLFDESKPSKKSQKRKKKSNINFFDPFDENEMKEIDEGNRNLIGNVPLEWYEEYPHIGYDSTGKRIMKTLGGDDKLDDLVRQTEDPHYLQSITDERNQRELKVSSSALQNIVNIQHRREFPSGFNQYRPFYAIAEHDARFPLRRNEPSKRSSLIVDLDERKIIRKLKNKMEYHKYIPSYRREHEKKEEFYHMWDESGQVIGGQGKHPGSLPAPREKIPENTLSYRPPPEYVEDGEEIYSKMSHIPQPENFVNNRLERCMELYLCTREKVKRYRKAVAPESLFPKSLPHPKDLRPFPEIQSVLYEGHKDIVRSISVDPTGQWLVSGDESGEVRQWEIETGRCLKVWKYSMPVTWVSWNPNPEIHLFAIAVDQLVVLICPPTTGTRRVRQNTMDLFPILEKSSVEEGKKSGRASSEIFEDFEEEGNIEDVLHREKLEKEKEEIGEEEDDDSMDQKDQRKRNRRGKKRLVLQWKFPRDPTQTDGMARMSSGILCQIVHRKDVTHIDWHFRGDFFSSLADPYIFIHQLSTRKSQKPFRTRDKKRGGKYQRLVFHPKLPFFYVVTQRKIKIYNLQKQKLRKILTKHRCRYISDIAIHPQTGEHMLIGGYDKRLEWFETEIASKPCKSMKFHREAVRSVKFHKKYPLFASCSDDAKIHLFHYKVFDDWVKDPLIVPLKVLKGHQKHKFLGVMDIQFHPFQPWLFSSGSDNTIRLYTS